MDSATHISDVDPRILHQGKYVFHGAKRKDPQVSIISSFRPEG